MGVMAEAPAYKGSMGWKLLLLCVGLTLCISPGLVCGDQATLGYPQSPPATSHTAHFPQQEVTAPLGYPSSYPVEGADTGLTASGSQYYSNYPTGGEVDNMITGCNMGTLTGKTCPCSPSPWSSL